MLRRTREELARLLDEVPAKWRPLFDLHVAPFKPSQSVSRTVSPTLQIWSAQGDVELLRDAGTAVPARAQPS